MNVSTLRRLRDIILLVGFAAFLVAAQTPGVGR